ncbi:hypothetical protein [Methylorubrum extorquens]|uniref:Uncharacterized protein n=1 Tax=Methylorubrum extorquens (strain CM4 / NCIMB 13688) TaxID=440085 RepID=B7KVZ4_METC4|nr:hypothetical protein [Methylorubrum extorquens]ACK82810.1 conserved hypothetical protein [Methylorubrum extorquens CM4]
MRLHWLQGRRARRLPMPLPPKPKRPLGPPVLFNWNGVDVRTRADIEAAGHTWDEFLDSYAANDDLRLVMLVHILQLVPPGERQDLHHEIRRRRRDYRDSMMARNFARQEEVIAEQTSWFERFLRRA